MNKPNIYLGMCADLIHHGHINILKEAAKYGNVVVGLITDAAMASYKRFPHLTYESRKEIVESIRYVHKVLPQYTLDYSDNLELIKPEFVMHGDDWKDGVQAVTRMNIITQLEKWSGKLIEVPYTKGISSTIIQTSLPGISKSDRLKSLITLLDNTSRKNPLTFLDISSPVFVDTFRSVEPDALRYYHYKKYPYTDTDFMNFSILSVQEILRNTNYPLLHSIGSVIDINATTNYIVHLQALGVSGVVFELEDIENHLSHQLKSIAEVVTKFKDESTGNNFLLFVEVPSTLPLDEILHVISVLTESGIKGIIISRIEEHNNALMEKYRSLIRNHSPGLLVMVGAGKSDISHVGYDALFIEKYDRNMLYTASSNEYIYARQQ